MIVWVGKLEKSKIDKLKIRRYEDTRDEDKDEDTMMFLRQLV